MTIQELLTELRVDFLESGHHHSRFGWIQLRRCPFCSGDNYQLGFQLALKYFSCWRCGGLWAPKVLEALGCSPSQARAFLAGYVEPFPESKRGSIKGQLKLPRGIGPLQGVHRRYLRARGFDPDELERVWGIKGIGLERRLGWRIYIPIIDHGQQVSWTTRAIGNRISQRYISAAASDESVPHKRVIYGADFCAHSVVVVEGPLDAWAVGPGAGATFGTAFTSAQVKRLVEFPRRVVCFDSSPEAQGKARELAAQLACFPGVTDNVVLDAKDPAEATPAELKRLRRIAKL